MKKILLIIFLVCVVFLSPIFGYYSLGSQQGYVNDYTGTLTSLQENELEKKISVFEQESTNEIVVVIIDSMEGDYIENFAVKLFEEWMIGKKEKDNGVLVLVSLQDRRMRIEVGYGLEGTLTDAQASWIIENVMTPNFKEERYYKGINQSVDKIIEVLGGKVQTRSNVVQVEFEDYKKANRLTGIIILGLFVFSQIAFFTLLLIVSIGKYKRAKAEGKEKEFFKKWLPSLGGGSSDSDFGGSSDSGDGSSSTGGGSSGGGGASGSW